MGRIALVVGRIARLVVACVGGLFAISLGLLALTSFGSSYTVEPLTSAEASRWLRIACGVTLSSSPGVLKGSVGTSHAVGSPWRNISGVIAVSEADISRTIDFMKATRSLHQVDTSDDTSRFESFPGARWTKSCMVDPTMKTFSFSYRD